MPMSRMSVVHLFKRRILRAKCSKVCFYVVVILIAVVIILRYLSPSFIKIENMDLPLTGDFPCKDSVLPNKCAFYLGAMSRFPTRAKYICSTMFSKCQGFVYNTGTNIVVLKSIMSGFPQFSPGFELYIKSSYVSLLNLTVEECAVRMSKETSTKTSDLACNIPKLDPFDQSLMGLIKDTKLECKGTPITKYVDNQLTFITEGNDVKEVTYETIIRKNHDFGHGVGQTGTLTRAKNTVTLNDDAVRVIYYQDGKKQDFHMSVAPLPDVLSREGKEPYIPMDIMILGYDSVSRSHFYRKLPQIQTFLEDELNTFIYKGYSIVGDGTTAAILAVLTGNLEEDLPEARKSKNGDHIDKWPFIFNTLHKHGYATFWSEDQAKYGSVHYRLKGFLNKPVDHWMRNFWLAASEQPGGNEYYCLGMEPAYRKRYRLIKSFWKAYPRRRKFSFSFFSIGHDDTNALGYVQYDFLQFLQDIKKDGLLDNTLLVVLADHGIRYGAIRSTTLGKLEERLPLLALSVPKWFKEKYPDYTHHLQANTERLTTPFDLHATFHHILSKSHHKTYKYGQSLLEEIPKSRTCQEAGNAVHFCPCLRWKPVNPNHKHIKQIAEETVLTINKLIKTQNLEGKCSLLVLEKVQNAVSLLPNDQVETFEKSADVDGRVVAKGAKPKGMCQYQVHVVTSPNNGIYEVTGHVSSMTPHVNPEMSRLDQYGDQPKCIMGSHPRMRKYCYCINQ